jgi:hypothetical protein
MSPDDNGTLRLSIPAREYIDREVERAVRDAENRINHQREVSDSRFMSIEEARRLAKIEQDKRLDGMNEFRETLRDQASTFMTRRDYDVRHQDLVNRIESAEKVQAAATARIEGRAGLSSWIAPNAPAIISLIVAIAALAVVVLR